MKLTKGILDRKVIGKTNRADTRQTAENERRGMDPDAAMVRTVKKRSNH